jgi:anti-sigma28 factor (negative regulator of flagellin synthesis)
MANKTATKKSMLSSARTQTETATTTPKVKFGKYSPEAKLKATGKRVTAEHNNERVKAVSGKTIKEAIATGLYTMSGIRYDIEKVKTLEIA